MNQNHKESEASESSKMINLADNIVSSDSEANSDSDKNEFYSPTYAELKCKKLWIFIFLASLPSPKIQKEKVSLKYLKRRGNQSEYAISSGWWQTWCDYVNLQYNELNELSVSYKDIH